jgi:hypothetical protein
MRVSFERVCNVAGKCGIDVFLQHYYSANILKTTAVDSMVGEKLAATLCDGQNMCV